MDSEIGNFPSPDAKEKILIIHPFLKFYGGAEYMLSEVLNYFPRADLFTFAYNKKVLKKVGAENRNVISPFGDSILSNFYRELSILYPALIETYNFSEYDKIISLSYAYVHGLIFGTDQKHISFVLTPMRALWMERPNHWLFKFPFLNSLFNALFANQRLWDRAAANRPDKLIAISGEIQKRVRSFWGLNSEIIYPPVNIEKYKPTEKIQKKEYYITHARLVAHKKIDVIIQAFQRLKRELYILGEGRDEKKLRMLAGGYKNIHFLNFVSEQEKLTLLQEAKGYIFAAHEDFGVGITEAIAAGTPVLAYGRGGATEIIQEKVNGMFFNEQISESIVQKFGEFERNIDAGTFQQEKMYQSVEKFSKENFLKNLAHIFD